MPGQHVVARVRTADGRELIAWLGRRDARGLQELRSLMGGASPVVGLPLLPDEPTELEGLDHLGRTFEETLTAEERGR